MSESRFSKKGKFEIAMFGRSNVGKSSIVRELTGHKVRVGKRPGVTLKPTVVKRSDLVVTDHPGFGFMSGVKERKQDIVKDRIVRGIEKNSDEISLALLVIDAPSFVDVVGRWESRNEIPIDIEMFDFLAELEVDTIIVPNKMDKVENENEELDEIISRFGLLKPWTKWKYVVAPSSAKKGDLGVLKSLIRERLHDSKRDDLLKYL
ncbi:GTP-binding protein EngB required for normal cell division [Methanohalophilus levihalophilus]|uniref:GTP-binding protein EngB n=1 Tax=Methanohalophilus levihalophilus TaxID=1431282 RepID=UPI001AE3623C|nr:GTP-binding protein EngB [Methanohalophilus levihalophilus]MBP2029695.1 GTP-binding protein EngB required for normal cell division [Methanohalophilus levihalophilus]